MTESQPTANPTLSLILCARNDRYMGDSRWRLETALNFLGDNVFALGQERAVDVVVADWGSDVPLSEVVRLSPEAAVLVSFVVVPPSLARELQGDSPFPEVLALNAAARRARGAYIGRIDQDTLVGSRFLEAFARLRDGEHTLSVPLESALMFSRRRDIPYQFAVRTPPLGEVAAFIHRFERLLRVERGWSTTVFEASVGIWLAHRDRWDECGGYDERMIYMNLMEVNMIRRLMLERHEVVDVGKPLRYPFYHLEHFPPRTPRSSSVYRKVNSPQRFAFPDELNPNGPDWGLDGHPLDVVRVRAPAPEERPPERDFGARARILFVTGMTSGWYSLTKPIGWKPGRLLRHRAEVVRDTVRGRPLVKWPSLIRRRWRERASRVP